MSLARKTPPDQAQRDRIANDLDTSLLVEAAAGTGKTTSMVARMVNLLREGKCRIDTLAAVTFTRKSAAELRARFQLALEKEAAGDGAAQPRLREALGHIDQCFIGTIHSFCARLLRERPMEAQVDLAFRELDDEEDELLRTDAWEEYVAELHSANSPLLDELSELGLSIGQLQPTFLTFALYPDVQDWPAPVVPLSGIDEARRKVLAYVDQMAEFVPTFPNDRGSDELMDAYERVVRLARLLNLEHPPGLMQLLEEFKSRKVTQRCWPGKREQAKREEERWLEFIDKVAAPQVTRWREHRYETILRTLRPAMAVYDQKRRDAAGLNFQDLLMRAADLLRDKPAIRAYFRRRVTHLLVDEFQDTDPVQAEVMLLLSADDHHEKDWRRCQPVPGSLFVVGDPKQSIYRFRRADIVTYNKVKEIIETTGGAVVPLTTNFRTIGELVGWANEIFEDAFPAEATEYSPSRRSMHVGRVDTSAGTLRGLYVLRLPDEVAKKDDAVEYESTLVAQTIRQALDSGATVPEPTPENPAACRPARPGDFLIVTYKKKHLAHYARKLGELGIPHQVTGGSALGQSRELALLADCLTAVVEPENPVALVAMLRGELFGTSDVDLYAFRKAGGRFDYRTSTTPSGADEGVAMIAAALERLRGYAEWFRKLPSLAAIERVAGDLGLVAHAGADVAGNIRAGSLAKALETLRAAQSETASPAELVRRLRDMLAENRAFDGLPARPHDAPAVRLMNLHKVKGLEAPVVFLADPSGKSDHDIEMHVDRSGETSQGYMKIVGPATGFHRPVLAQPSGWDQHFTEATKFGDAEFDRLMYVAATRAGSQLAIVQNSKNNNRNYWEFFHDWLTETPELEPPGIVAAPTGKSVAVAPKDVKAAEAEIEHRWQRVAASTFNQGSAKLLSQPQKKPDDARPLPPAVGEHGTEWGTVIHLLLQTKMLQPNADLHSLAIAALSVNELEATRADEAVAVVERVVQSAIWRRAQASSQSLVEVPFTKLLPADSPWAVDGRPTLVRGVIDLVFREEAGWVVVDYKTDRAAKSHLSNVVEHYRGQVTMYAQLWAEMTGEAVHECGLYFTEVDEYQEL